MDNASKALIMAGAILIAVALVSLGVYLYQSASSKVTDGTRQVDSAQMIMLNGEIEKFEAQIKGSELRQLSRLMSAHNANKVFPTDLYLTSIGGSGDTTAGNVEAPSTFREAANYTVTLDYGTTTNTKGWVIGARYDDN